MGTMIHHAIIVTVSDDDLAAKAREQAVNHCGAHSVSEISKRAVNGYRSFAVWPDGSKEGWEKSTDAEAGRTKFLDWLDRQRYGDGSTSFEWVLVEFGERRRREGAAVIRSSYEVNVDDSYTGPHELDAAGGA